MIIAVFQKVCFIVPSKELPKKQPLLLWKPICKTFQRPELDNLVKMNLKLICLNNKKDKIDNKADSLFIEFQHALNFFEIKYEVLVTLNDKCQVWEEIDYLIYLPCSMYSLML